jgi:hypothetical protein
VLCRIREIIPEDSFSPFEKEKDHPEAALKMAYACNSRPEGRSYAKELSINNLPISRSNVVRIQGAARGAYRDM